MLKSTISPTLYISNGGMNLNHVKPGPEDVLDPPELIYNYANDDIEATIREWSTAQTVSRCHAGIRTDPMVKAARALDPD
ncbi:hypothetical protein ACLOJK_016394 [Asimina triloba]